MLGASLAFALGVWSTQQLPVLPAPGVRLWLTAAAVLLAMLTYRLLSGPPGGRMPGPAGGSDGHVRVAACVSLLLAALLTGSMYSSWRAELRLSNGQVPAGDLVTVTGRVRGLPASDGIVHRFDFVRDDAAPGEAERLRLVWYDNEARGHAVPALLPGERWQLRVRLKPAHGFANPGGFDYERWLLQRGVRATGSVRHGPINRKLDARPARWIDRIDRWRAARRGELEALLPDTPARAALLALTLGDQSALSRDDWHRLQVTGTGHLMAVSGLHITLVAATLGWLASACWRRVPALALRMPAMQAGVVAGVLPALAYALVSGFGIPAQRALVMLSVLALVLLRRQETRVATGWSLALVAVLLFDPWAVLSLGFWLSFLAVAVILICLSGRPVVPRRWRRSRQALRMQWGLSVALAPVVLGGFGVVSLISPLANLLVVPLAGVLLPLALLALLLSWSPLWWLAHLLASGVFALIDRMASLPLAALSPIVPPVGWLAVAVLGMGLMLLPRPLPLRWPALTLLLLPLLWQAPRPDQGEAWVTVLDVGQGSAIHLQTAGHDIMIDAGPRYGRGADAPDAAERAVLPYLRSRGVSRLDMLLLTHQDADHIGGAASLIGALPPSQLVRQPGRDDAPGLSGLPYEVCEAGRIWRRDGVLLQVLHPVLPAPTMSRNNRSCVLSIETAGGRMLILSDLEAEGEAALLARGADGFASDVLVAPHHGSRTSSTAALVAAIRPSTVVYSVGFRNGYGHPHPEVVARWAQSGASQRRTDRDGAIEVRLGQDSVRIDDWRSSNRRYWRAPDVHSY